MFQSFGDGKILVKMRKPSKNKSLLASWEGAYMFIGSKDKKGGQEQDEGARICIFRDKDDQTWQRTRWDLQIYHTP